MDLRNLGSSGLRVSAVGLGCNNFGGRIDLAATRAVIDKAFDCGITLFDTADVYGNQGGSEDFMGQVMGDMRKSIVLATKFCMPMSDDGSKQGASRRYIMQAVEASLKRLRTDWIDLYQVHRFDPLTPVEETLRALDDLVRAGKVLYVGVSEWDASQIRRAVEIAEQMGFDRLVSNQPQYSMLYRVIEAEVVPTSQELGLGQIVWSPIAQGVLTGKYLPGQPPPEGSRATDPTSGHFTERLRTDEILERVQLLKPIAEQAGLSMAQLAVAWVLQNDNVSSAIIGATRPEQVHENVKASGVVLEPEVMGAIDNALGDVVKTDPRLTVSPETRP